MRAVWGRGGYTAPPIPPPLAAHHIGHVQNGRTRDTFSRPELEARQGYENFLNFLGSSASLRWSEKPMRTVHKRTVRTIQKFFSAPLGGNLDELHFWSSNGVAEGGKAQKQKRKKSSPLGNSILAPKEVRRGFSSGGCGLEA